MGIRVRQPRRKPLPTVTLIFEMGNDVFQTPQDLAMVLRLLAAKYDLQGREDFCYGDHILDGNGNHVGTIFGKLDRAPRI